MRLIDADALNLDYEVEMADDWKTAHEIANIVKYAPSVDAVEVVRCKDCRHWGIHDMLGETEEIKACTCGHYFVGKNGYCVYGERK